MENLVKRVQGNDGRMNLPTLTISAAKGWLDQRERFSSNIAGNEQKNYTLLSRGELSYNRGNSKLAKYGVVFSLKSYEEALVPRVYHSFKVSDIATPDFIEYMFSTKKTDRELGKLISSGARMDGLLNINFDDFKSIKVVTPEINEQQKISVLFRQIDNAIALHQQKLDLLKQNKKSFLQTLFPKKEKPVPNIRFSGFDEEWEQRKLKEHASYRRGSFPQPYGNKDWYDGEGAMPFVQVVDVTSHLTLVDKTKQKISKLAQPQSVFVPKGKVVVTLQGSIGRVAITQYDSYVDRTLLIFEEYEKSTSEYFWAYTIQQKFEIEKQRAPGGTIKTITKEALSSFEIFLPNYNEQKKIGFLLKQLDDTVALQEAKIKSLQQMKKAFLQKLFI